MNPSQQEILAASILLEEKVSRFYSLLAVLFEEDALFWSGLAKEEDKHAALIASLQEFHSEENVLFPRDAFPASIDEIDRALTNIDSLIRRYRANPPGRRDAYEAAIRIEESAGEHTFQLAASRPEKSPEHRLFAMLVGYEKDHARRIREKIARSGIV